MMTAACLVVSKEDASKAIECLVDWPFTPQKWGDVTIIRAPDLSLREKLKIDEHLSKDPKDIISKIGFLPAGNKKSSIEAIESYRTLHRYYPAFHHVEA